MLGNRLVMKVRKRAKIRNRYNQVPHLTRDTNGKVTQSQIDITNESQEIRNRIMCKKFYTSVRIGNMLCIANFMFDVFFKGTHVRMSKCQNVKIKIVSFLVYHFISTNNADPDDFIIRTGSFSKRKLENMHHNDVTIPCIYKMVN